jgi:hypothetical protein
LKREAELARNDDLNCTPQRPSIFVNIHSVLKGLYSAPSARRRDSLIAR